MSTEHAARSAAMSWGCSVSGLGRVFTLLLLMMRDEMVLWKAGWTTLFGCAVL